MDEQRTNGEERSQTTQSNQSWLVGLLIALLAIAGVGFGYGYSQHRATDQLAANNQQMGASMSQLQDQNQNLTATIGQMRTQMDALNSKLADLSKPPARSVNGRAVTPRRRVDPMVKQLQAKLGDQQKQLDQMQSQQAQDRSDLETELGSTRDDLNGSIAKTHDELVALERRGQRNYFEFDLSKSKNFQRVGPVLLSLRKADVRHAHYNMTLLVDDKQLTKKSVDLYEPVWIYRNDDPAPLQVVVNQIEKNFVHGYVSAPKFSKADLAAGEAQSSAPAPTPQNPTVPPAQNQNPASKPPSNLPHPQ